MDTETIVPNKKKFPITIVLGGILTVALVATMFQYYQHRKNSSEMENLQTKELTETEKQMMAQVAELDEARTQNKAQGTSQPAQILEQQIQELDALRATSNN